MRTKKQEEEKNPHVGQSKICSFPFLNLKISESRFCSFNKSQAIVWVVDVRRMQITTLASLEMGFSNQYAAYHSMTIHLIGFYFQIKTNLVSIL